MSSSFQQFLSTVREKGIAPVNRYRLTIGIPQALRTYATLDGMRLPGAVVVGGTKTDVERSATQSMDNMSLMCQNINIPGYNVNAQDTHYGTFTRKIPFSKTFGECDALFISSGLMEEKKLMDKWIKLIFNENTSIEFYDDIVADINIEVMNNAGDIIYQVKLLEAYPSVINPINLDRNATNQIQTFQVTFNYWKMEQDEDTATVVSRSADILTGVNPVSGPSIFGVSAGDILFTASVMVDIYKQVGAIKKEIERGLDPTSATRMLRQIAQQVRNVTGVPDDQVMKMLEYINDIVFSIRK